MLGRIIVIGDVGTRLHGSTDLNFARFDEALRFLSCHLMLLACKLGTVDSFSQSLWSVKHNRSKRPLLVLDRK